MKILVAWQLFDPYYCHKEGWGDEKVRIGEKERKRRMERVGAAIKEGWPGTHFQRFCDPFLGHDS